MDNTSDKLKEMIKPTEKERLELVEKKVEIQKKRLEIKKVKLSMSKINHDKEKENLELIDKKLSIRSKLIENKKAKLDLEETIISRRLEEAKLLNDNIFSVLISLSSKTIDVDRTILGSEPFLIPLIVGKHRDIALEKLMQLITKL